MIKQALKGFIDSADWSITLQYHNINDDCFL